MTAEVRPQDPVAGAKQRPALWSPHASVGHPGVQQNDRVTGSIEIMSEHMGDGPGMELLKKHLEIQDTAITDDDYFANPPAVTQ